MLALADVSLLTETETVLLSVVAAALVMFVAAFAWPVGRKVYHVARRALSTDSRDWGSERDRYEATEYHARKADSEGNF